MIMAMYTPIIGLAVAVFALIFPCCAPACMR